jgi:membrane-bound inhibitor of C-type lysozyme
MIGVRMAILRKGTLLALATAVSVVATVPARAQTFRHYTCRDGAQFELAFFPRTTDAFVQLDGKSLRLPRFVSITGTRYRVRGITLWIRGDRATLRRAGRRTECRVQ